MEVKRSITVNLTPNEIKDIIIEHLLKNENIHIDDVTFNIEKTYSGYGMGETVHHDFSGAKCDGILGND